MGDFNLDSYNTVDERIIEFREKYPTGCLRPLNPETPFEVVSAGGQFYVVVAVAAFRTPDDPCPGAGVAWEPVPGRTPFTKDSELQNAETSAWGRALIAVGAADARKGIASRHEVQNRRADADALAEETHRLTEAARKLGTTIAALPADEREAIKAKMANAGLSFTRALTQAELDTIESWTSGAQTPGEAAGVADQSLSSGAAPAPKSGGGEPRQSEPEPPVTAAPPTSPPANRRTAKGERKHPETVPEEPEKPAGDGEVPAGDSGRVPAAEALRLEDARAALK